MFLAAAPLWAVQADVILAPGNVEVLADPCGSKVAQFAAADLTNHLSKVLGCDVPIVSLPNDQRVQIVVGDSKWTRSAGIDVSKLPRDAFRIKSKGGKIYLAGRDHLSDDLGASLAKGVYPRREHATAFAVCEFLERYAGVRFYFPDEYGIGDSPGVCVDGPLTVECRGVSGIIGGT